MLAGTRLATLAGLALLAGCKQQGAIELVGDWTRASAPRERRTVAIKDPHLRRLAEAVINLGPATVLQITARTIGLDPTVPVVDASGAPIDLTPLTYQRRGAALVLATREGSRTVIVHPMRLAGSDGLSFCLQGGGATPASAGFLFSFDASGAVACDPTQADWLRTRR